MRVIGHRHTTSGILLSIAAVTYATWVIGHLVNAGLSSYTSYASELAAVGEPWSWFFRTGDFVSGALVAAGGLAMWARTTDRHHRVGWGALIVFGATTMVDALSPLSCVATIDPVCARNEASFQVPATHLTHMVTSVVVGIALLVAMVWLSFPRRTTLVFTPRWPWLLSALTTIYLVSLLWTVAASFHIGPLAATLGLAQRISLAAASAWMLVVGIGCAVGIRRQAPARRSQPA